LLVFEGRGARREKSGQILPSLLSPLSFFPISK